MLKGQLSKPQLALLQQLHDAQRLRKQELLETLHENFGWLNNETWFDALLRMWVFGAACGLPMLNMLCVL
jgi:hypothetical protein